ncbi:MAG: phosphoribosylamine--glycine ligase [Candidatus Levybacteria bacterium]|nr:phosphoribosylamine--glycine ligase [Candidatus Levybacteria bacterium]
MQKERIMIVGEGAREHAIGWKIRRHHGRRRELFFAPGNGGTEQIGQNIPIGVKEIDKLVGYAFDNKIDFTVVGPDDPLARGIVDAFNTENLPIFGHTQEAAKLEWSKAEAVRFMRRHGIPHPASSIFTDSIEAQCFIYKSPWERVVLKADGLALGKGVILPDTTEEAIQGIKRIMIGKEFKDAGKTMVVQERLEGIETSVIGLVGYDQKSQKGNIFLFVPAQDYKRIDDEEKGLNTGGMGSYAPSSYLTPEQLQAVRDTILLPTVNGMIEEGKPLCGALYVGVMITKNGIKVIEYNARLGDPETQVQLRLLESDLLEAMKACNDGTFTKDHLISNNRAAVGIVLASNGYPGKYEADKEIHGLEKIPPRSDVVVFHAGTKKTGSKIATDGGRVMTVTATGKTKEEARGRGYRGIKYYDLGFEGAYYRKTIAS